MKKYNRIKSYNKKYTEELEQSIKTIMPKLIEAFTNIYGEEHKNYIESTLKSLKYIYFIPEKYLKLFNKYPNFVSNHNSYIIEYYIKYLKYLNYKSQSIKDEDLSNYIFNNYITKSEISNEQLNEYNILYNIIDDNPAYTFILDNLKVQKVILLPLYIIDLKTIIHELNHALCIEPIGIYYNSIISPNLFSNVISEEIINDYIAQLVLEEYKSIGGIIPKNLNRFKIGNNYKYNYYIINYLFEILSPLILESLISKRYNLFIKTVGKKNYNHLCQLISILYKNGFNEAKYIEIIDLVNKIYDKVINIEFIDYELYFNKLEKEGYNLKRLKLNR